MIKRSALNKYLNTLLKPHDFSDYCPNGLQVEGKDEISKIAFALSATKESISKAVEEKADCLIVHHGLFWHFHGTKTITGSFSKRIKPLIQNEISLFGYHLPLDAQIDFGNAATIAKKLNLKDITEFGDYKGSPTGVKGKFKGPINSEELKEKLADILSHHVHHAKVEEFDDIRTIGIITGGANGDWKLAKRQGLDSYLTGEMSEHDWHESKEAGVHMFAGGHNATEQLGVMALMNKMQEDLEIESVFIPSENPA